MRFLMLYYERNVMLNLFPLCYNVYYKEEIFAYPEITVKCHPQQL